MKHLLVFGACGNVGPYVTPWLESYYHVHLTDIGPHPFGKSVTSVDVTSYCDLENPVLWAGSQTMGSARNFELEIAVAKP